MINAIFAVDAHGGIGNKGTLPWPHNPEDLQYFKQITSGHIVVMGRNTWDDPMMPKPLPGRLNLVITSKPICMPGVITISSNVEDRLKKIQDEFPNKEMFIIGGKQVLESCRPLIDRIYLTRYKGVFNADTRLDLRQYLFGFATRQVTPGTNCTHTVLVNENIFR